MLALTAAYQKHRQVARMVAWAVLPLVVLGIVYMALTKPHSPAPQRRSRRGRARDRETDGDGEGEGEEEGGGDRAVGDAVADASGAACAASLAAGEGMCHVCTSSTLFAKYVVDPFIGPLNL